MPVGVAVAGHHGVDGGIDGSVTLLDLDGGNPALIFDEC